jgi:arsenite methyltransferase
MIDGEAEKIRQAVSEAYASRAREVVRGAANSCCGDSPAGGVMVQFYEPGETQRLPESVVSYGCGNPVAIAGLQRGEIVLDLGSGAGLDCFLAAERVGPTGRAIGVDMTDEMLALAEHNRSKIKAENVEFRKGLLEQMPVENDSIDVIISNCVINLSPDKDQVFAEAFRALRGGGRLHVSDVVLLRDLSSAELVDMNLWAGCVSGAHKLDDYGNRLATAGFAGITIDLQQPQDASAAERAWRNAIITAYKPALA